jgi:hypothetical protein
MAREETGMGLKYPKVSSWSWNMKKCSEIEMLEVGNKPGNELIGGKRMLK